jgi:cobalt-zinc-cadmium efflux system outer membrane protein
MAVAGAERDAALLAYKRAEADLARDIRIAYAELRAAEDRAVLARDNVAQAEELARSAGLYVEVGRDPPLRKLRADALLAEAKAEQARTFGELLTARRALADLIGSSDSELSSAGFDDGVTPPLLPPATPTLDEQVAAAERDAARARIRVAQADAVPDLTASAGVRRISDGRETAFVAGIALPLPIRDRNRGNIAAAGSDSLAAEAALAQVRLDANRAQHDARMLLGAANERVAALSGPGLAQAEEALRLARIGYAAGKFSLIELIDAQSALNAAREALISARLDRARALAALNRATAQ